MSRNHGLAVTFAVCSSRFEPKEGLPVVSDLRQRFLPLKIVQPRVLKHELAFYIRLRCICWIFDLESMNYSCFLGDKSDALRLDEKQHGGTKQWTHSSNRFYIPFCRTNIRKFSVPIQSWNCFYLVTEFMTYLSLCLVPIFNVSLRKFHFILLSNISL